MENSDLNSYSENEILDMYSSIIESGNDILLSKFSCPYGYEAIGYQTCCNSGGCIDYWAL